MKDNWNAWHIFIHDYSLFDKFIYKQLFPFMKSYSGKLEKWFFIRYWDGGPHIRLRIKNLNEKESTFLYYLQKLIKNIDENTGLTKENFYSNHKFDGENVEVDNLSWYEHKTIHSIPYRPEVQRYGGEYLLRNSEDLFTKSTTWSEEIITNSLENRQKRLLLSFDLMIIQYKGLLKNDLSNIKEFFDYYSKNWEKHLDNESHKQIYDSMINKNKNKIKERFNFICSKKFDQDTLYHVVYQDSRNYSFDIDNVFEAGQLISPITNNRVLNEKDFIASRNSLVSSQIHMTNNRIGVAPPDEYYLSSLISNSI